MNRSPTSIWLALAFLGWSAARLGPLQVAELEGHALEFICTGFDRPAAVGERLVALSSYPCCRCAPLQEAVGDQEHLREQGRGFCACA